MQSGEIIIFDDKLPVETGDHLLRVLPSALTEDYIVTSANFHTGLGQIKSFWKLKVRRSDEPLALASTIINNITGYNARVNINSEDNSSNFVYMNPESLFSDLTEALRNGIQAQGERDRLLQAVAEMQNARQAGTFTAAYKNFITLAAEHINIVGPFIPALSNLL